MNNYLEPIQKTAISMKNGCVKKIERNSGSQGGGMFENTGWFSKDLMVK